MTTSPTTSGTAAPTTAKLAMDFTLLVEAHLRGNTANAVAESEVAEAMYALRAHVAAATGAQGVES